jgi:hypothetical protein
MLHGHNNAKSTPQPGIGETSGYTPKHNKNSKLITHAAPPAASDQRHCALHNKTT